jgi:hypothetical protein
VSAQFSALRAFFSDKRAPDCVTIPAVPDYRRSRSEFYAMNFLFSIRFRLLVCILVFAVVYFNNATYATWLSNSPYPAQAEESERPAAEKTMQKIPASEKWSKR